jgi:hypothetical protein
MDVVVEVVRGLPRLYGHGIICPQLPPKGSQPVGRQGKRHYAIPGKRDHAIKDLYRE